MIDETLKIAITEPLKVDLSVKLATFLRTKKVIKLGKEKVDDDKDFKETLLIDEVLEAENNG